jgi:hypothetical protein
MKRDVRALHLVTVQWLNSICLIRETVVGWPAVGKVPNCSRLMQYLGSGVWSLQKMQMASRGLPNPPARGSSQRC